MCCAFVNWSFLSESFNSIIQQHNSENDQRNWKLIVYSITIPFDIFVGFKPVVMWREINKTVCQGQLFKCVRIYIYIYKVIIMIQKYFKNTHKYVEKYND